MELTLADYFTYLIYFGIITFILANYVGIEKVNEYAKKMIVESGFEMECSYIDWVIPRMFKHLSIHVLKIALKSFLK